MEQSPALYRMGMGRVAREFKFFKPFIQQVYMLSRYRQGIYLGTGDIAVKKIILLKKLRA